MVTPRKLRDFSRHIEKLLEGFGNRGTSPGFWCRSYSWTKDQFCTDCHQRHACPGQFPKDRQEIRQSEFDEKRPRPPQFDWVLMTDWFGWNPQEVFNQDMTLRSSLLNLHQEKE